MTIKRLLNENLLLEQKNEALQSDLKAVLINRKKLENIEDIILKFSGKEHQTNNNINSYSSNFQDPQIDKGQTYDLQKDKSMNFTSAINPFNSNMMNQSTQSIKETKAPQWYTNYMMKSNSLNK